MRPLGLAALFCGALLAADPVPQWVKEAAASAVPTYPPKVSAVALLQEEQVTMEPNGQRQTHERGAVKALQRGARIIAYRSYDSRGGRIRSFQAWLVPPSGAPTAFDKKAVVDVSLASEEMYSELRAQRLDPGELSPGAVFAWEIVEEEKSIFTSWAHAFQEDEPVLVSRLVLTVPSGWEVRTRTFNHEEVKPQVSGGTYTWEVRDLPWIEPEEHSPGIHAIAPRLGISVFPSSAANPDLRGLKDWSSVSGWLSGFLDPPAAVTEPVRRKAAELTANAKTELDKIRALGEFTQKTTYVAVAIDLNRGGGHTPHAAEQTLARNYGDCKDKATLMRALLKAAGIESFITLVDGSDPLYVRSEWSAPQFDHAIIAIRVSPETKLPPVVEHPKLGRLLIFDPTSSTTPVGDLPEDEQGGYALISAGDQGDIVKLPVVPAQLNRVESRTEAQLSPDGRLSAQGAWQYFGQSSSWVRSVLRSGEPDALKRRFERSLAHQLGGVQLERIESADHVDQGNTEVKLAFNLTQFGQIMQQRLLVITPGKLAAARPYAFTNRQRKLPVRLWPRVYSDSVTLTVPASFKVDEIPDPVKFETAYGSYRGHWKSAGDKILFEQALEVKDTLAPAAEAQKIREFFERVSSSQNAPVVLLKQ